MKTESAKLGLRVSLRRGREGFLAMTATRRLAQYPRGSESNLTPARCRTILRDDDTSLTLEAGGATLLPQRLGRILGPAPQPGIALYSFDCPHRCPLPAANII